MQTYLVLLATALVAFSVRAEEPAAAAAEAGPAAAALGTGTVARVDGLDIPYDWFRHEFRSTFIRHGGRPGVRDRVFDDFLGRMILYADACRSGITNDPGVMARVDSQLRQMESFMQYQLAMARIGMIIEAHIEQDQLVPPAGPGTEDEARKFFADEIAGQPGAPESFDDLPERVQGQIRDRVGQVKLEAELRALVERVRTNLSVEVNQTLVDQVPMPAMRGDVPPGMDELDELPAAP